MPGSYKLAPSLIAFGRTVQEAGFPLTARCDLVWPEHPEANDPSQYLHLNDADRASGGGPSPWCWWIAAHLTLCLDTSVRALHRQLRCIVWIEPYLAF